MSELGYSLQKGDVRATSVFLMAAKERTSRDVSKVPNSEVVASFDHLVSAAEQCQGHGETKRLCGLQVDNQLELGWLLDRQVGRLRTPEKRARYAELEPSILFRYGNYSYGTRIWQISCRILRDTIWVVIPRYQAPFIMS